MSDDPPGPARATPADLLRAQHRERLLRDELPRVREAATAWRNGLGVLLAGLGAFGLVKGRSDVGQLASAWSVAAGALLGGALLAGATGALLLLRAAHGRPAVLPVGELPPHPIAERREAGAAARALRIGIACTLGCATLLVTAVGITWYGPGRTGPRLTVVTPSGSLCGSVIRAGGGTLELATPLGEMTVRLDEVQALRPVAACPPP
ncbi:hypothetical protein ACWC10_04640 [Streptomyces sp. NPDC001595]|uniref:hypothetical protein n=1 Tax=Streptomyces sp. NPDC001532 TaxID=3154520 RepID=UPI00332B408C